MRCSGTWSRSGVGEVLCLALNVGFWDGWAQIVLHEGNGGFQVSQRYTDMSGIVPQLLKQEVWGSLRTICLAVRKQKLRSAAVPGLNDGLTSVL